MLGSWLRSFENLGITAEPAVLDNRNAVVWYFGIEDSYNFLSTHTVQQCPYSAPAYKAIQIPAITISLGDMEARIRGRWMGRRISVASMLH